jgi:hypothetical protein
LRRARGDVVAYLATATRVGRHHLALRVAARRPGALDPAQRLTE